MEQLALALELKREKTRQVLENAGYDWQMLVRLVVRTMRGEHVTGEDIRVRCEDLNIRPHHHNAWGAMISQLASPKDGSRPYLIETGKLVNMRTAKSHARKTMVYLVRPDL